MTDTILPGALDPVPCADCGETVYSDLQQTFTKDRYGRVLCLECEYKIRGVSLCS